MFAWLRRSDETNRQAGKETSRQTDRQEANRGGGRERERERENGGRGGGGTFACFLVSGKGPWNVQSVSQGRICPGNINAEIEAAG